MWAEYRIFHKIFVLLPAGFQFAGWNSALDVSPWSGISIPPDASLITFPVFFINSLSDHTAQVCLCCKAADSSSSERPCWRHELCSRKPTAPLWKNENASCPHTDLLEAVCSEICSTSSSVLIIHVRNWWPGPSKSWTSAAANANRPVCYWDFNGKCPVILQKYGHGRNASLYRLQAFSLHEMRHKGFH